MKTVLRWLFERLVRLYYPVIMLEGGERIPVGHPVIFVLNHPNSLLDPVVLRLAVGRPVRFLAKATLFTHWISRVIMEAFGAMPVKRAHESGGGAADPNRNDETFARCREALRAGDSIALFPEGTSHSDPQMKPLKTGAARIALSAEKESGGRLGLSIVPVGLVYEKKATFRSRVLAVVGQPRGLAEFLPAYETDERIAVELLTAEIGSALSELVVQAETQGLLEGIARVALWTASPEAREDLGEQHARARELHDAYRRLSERDPERVEAIALRARTYARTLRQLGISDPWALEVGAVDGKRALRALVRLVATLPVALLGVMMSWVPYRLAGEVAKRVTRDHDLLGTVKLLGGATFCLLAWIVEAVVAGHYAGTAVGFLTLLVGPAAGYVALKFGETWSFAVEAIWHVTWRGFRQRAVLRLVARRRALAQDVARALREAGAA